MAEISKYIRQAHEAFMAADNQTSLWDVFSISRDASRTERARASHARLRLSRAGIKTVGDLKALPDGKILKVRNVGVASADLIYQIKHGERSPFIDKAGNIGPLLKRIISMIGEEQAERILLGTLPKEELLELALASKTMDELIDIIRNEKATEHTEEE